MRGCGRILREIDITEMSINVVPNSKPFKSTPYRVGPKKRKLEHAEIDKQLRSRMIEPVLLEWALPMLIVPKKNGK